MDLLSVIRRLHKRDKLSIREIARRTGLSRITIRKYLHSGIIEPRYPDRQTTSNLDPFAEMLERWLNQDTRRHRKRRRTAKQLHRDLVALSYRGSYDRVAAFVRNWKRRQRKQAGIDGKRAYVPLVFPPGDAFQFDWSEDWLPIDGKSTNVQIMHFKLSHSRAFFVHAYMQQTHEMLFDAHNHAFRVFGGISNRGIYDNMKTAVDKVGKGKQRQVNARFAAMASHVTFETVFCNPAAGWEKGQVEKNVRDIRYRLLQDLPACSDLGAVNDWLEQRCIASWNEVTHP